MSANRLRLSQEGRVPTLAMESPCGRNPVTGKVLSASEALAIDLVSEIHPDPDLEAAGSALAHAIAAMSPMALAQVKANLEAARTLPRDQAVQVECESFLLASAHPDHREAATAFLEKRAPRWAEPE